MKAGGGEINEGVLEAVREYRRSVLAAFGIAVGE